jgi:primosomal protein N' (replication factor Y)
MKKNQKYIISVVVPVRIPLNREQFFYYIHNKPLPVGTLIKVPFGKRFLEGIVLESKDDFKRLGNIKLKKISEVIAEKFITPKQVKLAKFISDYYFSSLGIVMKSFIPKIIKARKTKGTQVESDYNESKDKITLTKEQKSAIKEITQNTVNREPRTVNYLLHGPASSGKTQVYLESIKKIISNLEQNSAPNDKGRCPVPNGTGQALILLPEITITSQDVERYGYFFEKENIAIIHSKLSKGKLYENYQRIKSGKAKIIIGTRQAVFAPFKDLKIIVIDEEHDISHKQWDMNPKYDARQVAEKLSQIHKAKMVLGSATPRIETFFNSSQITENSSQSKYKLLKLSSLQKTKHPLQVKFIDLKKEHWKNWKKVKSVSPISHEMETEIRWTLKNNFQVILFINRQGMSKFSVCENCKEVLTCPDCERALTYKSRGNYECIHCKFETGDFPMCPQCQGMVFKNVGLGTERIESEIEKLFPSAKIARADSSSMKKSSRSQDELWKNFSSGKIDILIGTQMIAKAWDIAGIGLVGIIDADSLFSFPDFRTNEKAFALMTQVIGRAGRTKSTYGGKALIQTYHPENAIFNYLQERDYAAFYQSEIKERQSLSYPPFSHIIKLTFQDYSKEKVLSETKNIYEQLVKSNTYKFVNISPSHEPLNSKLRGRYRRQIIIKLITAPPRQTSENLEMKTPSKIKKIITHKLGNGWSVDVDPISVI